MLPGVRMCSGCSQGPISWLLLTPVPPPDLHSILPQTGSLDGTGLPVNSGAHTLGC